MKPYIPPAQYFKQLIDKHGIESSKVVHHGSYHNLDYILDGLTRHFRLMDGMTILDVGAGKFDVLGYLENRVIVGHYRGVRGVQGTLRCWRGTLCRRRCLLHQCGLEGRRLAL